jgi:hypothetical protein
MQENNIDANDKKRMLEKKINHYQWNENEIEKVKEGKSKGWKEHKIKNYYFLNVENPTKHHIKTLLNKIGKRKKKRLGANLNTDQGSYVQKGKKKKRSGLFFYTIFFLFIFFIIKI